MISNAGMAEGSDMDVQSPYQENFLGLPVTLTYERWREMGITLQSMHRSIQWWLGDWLLFGEDKFGQAFSQEIDMTRKSSETLKAAMWVSSKFRDISRRRQGLSWTHHKEVAGLPSAEADKLLRRAEAERMTTADVRAEVMRRKGTKPKILQIEGPRNSAESAPMEPVAQAYTRRPLGNFNSRADFIAYWESWLKVNFPNRRPEDYTGIADWWFDALAEYRFVGNEEKVA